ncbi:MAG: glycyl-radical enzyme activating protein [Candidatus Lokiarchaeia archaeon]|nr:glycyl-radical enzyme activating protein [Candidatus Lokiarchaeia archaeon]
MTQKEGIIFNIQRYSIHDGPGIRTTVFLKGCPLRCKWCSNPESINPFPELFLRKDRCDQCKQCIEICSPNAIFFDDNIIQINRSKCNLCMKCIEVCPLDVFNSTGKKVSIDYIISEVMQDELFYNNSGGGVTISGGEPLYQIEFTLNLLKEFKKKSLHTTLDTTGYANGKDFEKILPYTDLILFDIKHLDSKIHQKYTGIPNEIILDNFERCLKHNQKIWVRVPIIPNFNDSIQYIEILAKFLSNKLIDKVSLLKYHEWGKHKYKFLDRDYPLKNAYFINQDLISKFKEILESYGMNVTLDY